jgi:prepilin-type processing-associated H-X9-DG protein
VSARSGWTLAELLGVLAIVAALAAILLPSVTTAVHMLTKARCRNNLRQIGACVHAYAVDHAGLMPAERTFGVDDPATSPAWFHRLPPYLDASSVRSQVFQCPGFRWRGPRVFRDACPKSYKMNAYLDDRGERHQPLGGPARVPLFVDAVAGETGMGQWGHCVPSAVEGGRHRGVVNVLFLDGSAVAGIEVGADGRFDRSVPWRPDDAE